jgi:hypothetical protein
LTELKIHLRDRRPGSVVVTPWPEEEAEGVDDVSEGLGQNEGTVRFLWDWADGTATVKV